MRVSGQKKVQDKKGEKSGNGKGREVEGEQARSGCFEENEAA